MIKIGSYKIGGRFEWCFGDIYWPYFVFVGSVSSGEFIFGFVILDITIVYSKHDVWIAHDRGGTKRNPKYQDERVVTLALPSLDFYSNLRGRKG